MHGKCASTIHIHAAATIVARCILGNASTIQRKGAAISNFNAAFIAGDTAAVHGELAASGIFLFDFHSSTFAAISYDLGNSPGVLAVAEDKIAALNVDSPVTAIILHLDAVAIQAEVEGLVFRNGQGISTLQSHIVRQIDVCDIVGVGDFALAVPGLPGDAGRVIFTCMVAGRAANGVVGMIRRVGTHAGRAQQGTQAQRYTYDPFLPRHFVTRSSSRFISLRQAEGCGVYTPVVCGCGVLRLRRRGRIPTGASRPRNDNAKGVGRLQGCSAPAGAAGRCTPRVLASRRRHRPLRVGARGCVPY